MPPRSFGQTTLAQLLKQGIAELADAGIADPEISARKILEHSLKLTPAQLQMALTRIVDYSFSEGFLAQIKMRSGHCPLQYVIGQVDFYDVTLKADRRALIPRPETEILVEQAIKIGRKMRRPQILDIGTGSGNIAIALAKNLPGAMILAVDISEDALSLARENAGENNVAQMISFVSGDCCSENVWRSFPLADMIISNPPYVAKEDYQILQPEIILHEPASALIAEPSPTVFHQTIIKNSKKGLKRGGAILLEVGKDQAGEVAGFMNQYLHNAEISIIKDLAGISRVVMGQMPE